MYHYLVGEIAEKSATSLVLEVQGVGYFLQVPLSTSEKLPALGQQVKVLTHFVVREDAQSLYGFITEEERQLFQNLISVSGIGPKVAITVLSGILLSELRRAIVEGDVQVLKSIAGIGKKTAERIIVELREKIVIDGRALSGESSTTAGVGSQGALVEDSLEALVALGYRKQTAKTAIDKVLKDQSNAVSNVEDLIRASLKYF